MALLRAWIQRIRVILRLLVYERLITLQPISEPTNDSENLFNFSAEFVLKHLQSFMVR